MRLEQKLETNIHCKGTGAILSMKIISSLCKSEAGKKSLFSLLTLLSMCRNPLKIKKKILLKM